MKICVGICGSIAAFRSVDFVKELVARGHEVRCVLTRGGREFVSAKALETFCGSQVLSEEIFSEGHFATDHIAAARWAEAFVIYGATANLLARAAGGFADDFLCLQLLAFEGPVLVAPAMNPSMWKHPAVVHNTQLLRSRAWTVVGPVAGTVACGESGTGHLAPHSDIHAAIERIGSSAATQIQTRELSSLRGKRVLISAGPMRSAVDPVRAIQNRSSGRMGLEIARACRDAGAEVTVLLGPVAADMRASLREFRIVPYEGPSDYERALESLFPDCDIFFSAAAVLDFELMASERKIERAAFARDGELRVPLRPVDDIVAKFARRRRPGQCVVAFAAETGTEAEIIERATRKMEAKTADIMIANPVWPGLGPDAERNQLWVLRPGLAPQALGPALKGELARPLLELLWGDECAR